MTAKTGARTIRWIRRGTQAVFLLVFLALILSTINREGGAPSPWLQGFFLFDPLVLLVTFVSAHTAPILLLLALITVAFTFLFGRAFCGWICPFGTLHAACSVFRPGDQHTLAATEHWTRWHRVKYYVLAGFLVMAVFGGHWIGILDPFSFFYRAMTLAVVPGVQYAVEDGSTAVFHADPHLGPLHATSLTEPVYELLRDHVLVAPRQTFHAGVLVGSLFIAVLLLNLHRKRFWCRYVCPLGALLGLLARRPVLRLVSDASKCNECGLCQVNCQGAAVPNHPGHWMPSECFMCMNCAAKCNKGALGFAFDAPWKSATSESLDLSKRALIGSGAAGVVALVTLRVTPEAQGRVYNPELIRPPGARAERDFLERCVQCGMCMRVCPTNGLQPTFLEAGLEGLWTPRLDARIGYCEYGCNACGQMCPTEAIAPLPLDEKKTVKMGLATFDTTRCLPYAYNRNCSVCEEHCPIGQKAIYFTETDVVLRDGTTRALKVPHVDPDLCIGCGICENKCVFNDRPAIRVTSANETRHSKNQPILRDFSTAAPASDPYGASSAPSSAPSAATPAPADNADPYGL